MVPQDELWFVRMNTAYVFQEQNYQNNEHDDLSLGFQNPHKSQMQ